MSSVSHTQLISRGLPSSGDSFYISLELISISWIPCLALSYFAVFVQSLSHVQLFATTNCSTPGFPFLHCFPEFDHTHVHRVSDAVQPSNPLSPFLLLPSVFPSIRIFFNESVLHIRWPKYWNFSFSISPSNKHSVLISFRIYWLDLLAVQGTLKSLLHHHSLKASFPQDSAFFTSQLSYLYMTA